MTIMGWKKQVNKCKTLSVFSQTCQISYFSINLYLCTVCVWLTEQADSKLCGVWWCECVHVAAGGQLDTAAMPRCGFILCSLYACTELFHMGVMLL